MKIKKRFTKSIACAVVAIMAVAALSACAAKPASTSGGNGTTDGKVEISIAGWPSTEGASLDNMTALKEGFEKDNPDITIVPDTWGFDLKTFYPKAEAGLLPSGYGTSATELDKIVDAGYCADMTESLKRSNEYDLFTDSAKKLVERNGKIYGLPYNLYITGLAVNMDLFEAAGLIEEDGSPMQPKNWDEVAEFAVKIKEATGKPGLILNTSNNTGGWIFSNIAWSFGVDFMEEQSDGTWKATFDTPEMVEAMQYIYDLRWKYNVLPDNILVDNPEAQKLLATGNGAMLITGSDIGTKLYKYEMDPESLGMVAIPEGPKRHVALVGSMIEYAAPTCTEDQVDALLKWEDHIGNGATLNDTIKGNRRKSMETAISNGQAIGIHAPDVWNEESEQSVFRYNLIEEYRNMKPNASKHYDESLKDESLEWQTEEPVCAQDLYGVLDNCIQEILNNKDANIQAIVSKANSDFQINYLDNYDPKGGNE